MPLNRIDQHGIKILKQYATMCNLLQRVNLHRSDMQNDTYLNTYFKIFDDIVDDISEHHDDYEKYYYVQMFNYKYKIGLTEDKIIETFYTFRSQITHIDYQRINNQLIRSFGLAFDSKFGSMTLRNTVMLADLELLANSNFKTSPDLQDETGLNLKKQCINNTYNLVFDFLNEKIKIEDESKKKSI